jgi:hypothetical protein
MKKNQACEIIRYLREKMLEISRGQEPGKNDVIIPFTETIVGLLPKERAYDMTVAGRVFSFVTLLTIINVDHRPRIVLRKEGSPHLQLIPFALFEDLKEAIRLIQYASDVRPHVLEWYYAVFTKTYNLKSLPDSKVNSKGDELTEKRIAVTSRELIEATFTIQHKLLSTKRLLDTYIEPLINEGYVDKVESDLDRRANIYFPVIDTTEKKNLFRIDERNNSFEVPKIRIEDSTIYPGKDYVTSKIQSIWGYSETAGFRVRKIEDHVGREINIERLVEEYYGHSDD